LTINLHLPIEPKALPRVRHANRGKFVSSYYKKETYAIFDKYQESIIHAVSHLNTCTRTYISDMVSNAPKRLGIALYVVFYMPIPKSYSKKRKIELDGKPHIVKSDLDNLIKMILDRAEGILFDNDKRIYLIRAEKYYSDEPRIELQLTYEVV